LVHRESSFSASQAIPAATKAGSPARECVCRRSGFVHVGLWEALLGHAGGEAGWMVDLKSRSLFDSGRPPRRAIFAQGRLKKQGSGNGKAGSGVAANIGGQHWRSAALGL
jgi:hypothetical protein